MIIDKQAIKPVFFLSDFPDVVLAVSMQRLSATNVVMPKGRIINSCTVDYWTVFMLIMETQVSKLTLAHCDPFAGGRYSH